MHECAPHILLTLEPECFVQMKYRFQNFLPLQQRFLQYVHVEPLIDARRLLGNNLEVLLKSGKKAAASTPNLLERILDCLRNSFLKQK